MSAMALAGLLVAGVCGLALGVVLLSMRSSRREGARGAELRAARRADAAQEAQDEAYRKARGGMLRRDLERLRARERKHPH